jgi:hypothetical protein
MYCFLLVDEQNNAAIKASLMQEGDCSVPFVSTNDIVAGSWFLRDCRCDLLLIIKFNFRGRLQDHTDDMTAGNYQNSIYYHKEDVASPTLIRKPTSVQDLKRAVTKEDRGLSRFEMARAARTVPSVPIGHPSLTRLSPCLSLPLMVTKSALPCTMAVCVIFQARPQEQLGTEKLENLRTAPPPPFEANELFFESLSK